MLWVVQDKLFKRNRHDELINALERLDIQYIPVDVNKNKIISEHSIDENQPIITSGSIMLSQIAKEKNWTPGSLFNDNFSYNVWSKYYEDMLLNKDAKVSTLGQAQILTEQIFARPVLDNKTFNGQVFTKEDFFKLQQKSLRLEKDAPKPDTEILISTPKKIGQEHRHYIVDGKIITSSRYKLSGQPNFREGADDKILDFVQQAVKTWQPARAFVLDSYTAGEEVGIVEIGCICHAGFYECDIMKLVHALDCMPVELNKEKSNLPKQFKL